MTIVMVSTCRGYDGVGVDGDAYGGVGAGGRTTQPPGACACTTTAFVPPGAAYTCYTTYQKIQN